MAKKQEKKQHYVVTRKFVGKPGDERNLIEVQLMLLRGPQKPKRKAA